MKVLLVNPEFPDTYWSFRHALPFEGKRSAFPPLGLLTVSALLPQSWERRLVDLNVQSLKSRDIEWADMVFATAMLVQEDSLREVVASLWTQRGTPQIRAAGWVAMLLGALATLALGVGLMALAFYSDRSSADEDAYRVADGARKPPNRSAEQRR